MDEPKRLRLDETWNRRDLPVLVEVAQRLDAGEPMIRAREIAKAMTWEIRDVIAAMRALCPAYIDGRPFNTMQGVIDFGATGLTERGRRTVGLWPSTEGVDALEELLKQAADATDDADEKTLLRRAAGAVSSVSRDIMVDVVAAVVARQSGLG